MAEVWEDEGAWGSASRVPLDTWFPVNTATGEWQLPGQPPTSLASSAGMPDAGAPPVWGGTPDQAPLAIGQVAGTLAPQLGPQPRLASVARASAQGLLPEQPTMWGSIARSLAMASPTGTSILQGFDQQQQQQLTNRLALRRQQLLEEQETRQATQTSLDTLRKISEMPNKTMRNLMFDRYVADMSSSGQPLPGDMVEAFKKSSLDEGKQMAQMLTPMFEAAGIDPTTASQILQEGGDPKRLLEMIDMGLKAKKQKADEAEEARLTQSRQTLFGASGGAGTPTTAPTPGAPPPTTAGPPQANVGMREAPAEVETALQEALKQYPKVRPALARAIIARESDFDRTAESSAGAQGYMQLMPATQREMGVKDPFDTKQNILGGVGYFDKLLTRYGGNEALALAAYNAGPGRVDAAGGDLKKLPAETQAYVPKVLSGATASAGGGTAEGTRSMVAGPGAPSQDQAQLTRLNQQIAAMDQFIAENNMSRFERTRAAVNEIQQERQRLIQEREKLLETPRAVEKERQLQPLKLEQAEAGKALTPIATETARTLANNNSMYRSIGKIETMMQEGTNLPPDFINLVSRDVAQVQEILATDPAKLTGLMQQWETQFKGAKNDPRINRFLSALGNLRDLAIAERAGASVTGNELTRAMGAFFGSLPNVNQAFSLFAQNMANVKERVMDQLVTMGATVRPLSGGKAVYGSLPKEVRDRIERAERGEEEPPVAQTTPRPKVTGPIRQVAP